MKNINILYEDDFSLVINKPAGLAVQGGKGVKSSVDKILADYCCPPPLLVHRLDKDTSGALLAAKGREAASRFSRIFGAERKAVKLYTAVCASCVRDAARSEGVITDKLMIRGSLKESETGYKVVKTGILPETGFEYSVLELVPGTGRMHQIRRHLAMNGTPVLGDDKYGDFALNKKLRKTAGLKHLLLHSARLIIKEFKIDVTAPPPDYFSGYIFL